MFNIISYHSVVWLRWKKKTNYTKYWRECGIIEKYDTLKSLRKLN